LCFLLRLLIVLNVIIIAIEILFVKQARDEEFDSEVKKLYNSIEMVGDVNNIRMGMGGAPPKIGIFIRDYLRERGESYPSEIHRAYKSSYKGQRTLKGRTYRLCTYNSFMVYMSKLVLAGLVERTGRTEISDNPKASALDYPGRVYVRLTPKGERAPDFIWLHPLRIWYYPLEWEKIDYREYAGPGRRA